MSRPGTSKVPPLLVALFVAFGALGACSDATDPHDDLLAGLDEMAIYMAMVEELAAFNHTAEANANLRLALGSGIPLAEPVPPELFGHTLVYDQDTDAWIGESAPTIPDNVLRVMWYEVVGSFVAIPVVERGFIELADRGDPEVTGLDVRAVRTDNGPTTLADYTARFGETSTATTRTRVFEAAGTVSDGEGQLAFDTREMETEALGTGGITTAVELQLTSGALSYHVTLDEVRQGGSTTVNVAARVTVGGVESRMQLVIEEASDGRVAGTGALYHGGQKIADVAVSGTEANPDWAFTRPDGSAYTSGQQRRLGDLVSILLIPLATAAHYFS